MEDVPAYAGDAHKLFAHVTALAADAQLRALLLRYKCEALERTLEFVTAQQTRRLEREQETHAHAHVLHESVEGAIQRARLVRAALVTAASSDSDDGDHTGDEGELQSILAMAKRMRTPPPPRTPASKTTATRLEYPRRMKALLEQLRDAEAHESVRCVFCRKLSERLAMRESNANDGVGTAMERSRVHVGYAQQAARLQHAYTLLAAFTHTWADREASERFQAAVGAPTLAGVVPVYARVHQVR